MLKSNSSLHATGAWPMLLASLGHFINTRWQRMGRARRTVWTKSWIKTTATICLINDLWRIKVVINLDSQLGLMARTKVQRLFPASWMPLVKVKSLFLWLWTISTMKLRASNSTATSCQVSRELLKKFRGNNRSKMSGLRAWSTKRKGPRSYQYLILQVHQTIMLKNRRKVSSVGNKQMLAGHLMKGVHQS